MIIDAILKINPNAKVSIRGSDIDTCEITWTDTTEISKADIKAKMAELETEYDNNKYQRDRADQYKELKEQLDLLYHDMTSDKGDKTGEWYKHIKAVKDANPKPE
tara:strand:+ start:648 stop:962 length:315 start_codon:yes stop_codon:yes gene_type:complete